MTQMWNFLEVLRDLETLKPRRKSRAANRRRALLRDTSEMKSVKAQAGARALKLSCGRWSEDES